MSVNHSVPNLFLTHSLRAQFSIEGLDVNPLHGSADTEDASKEVEFFFPKENTLAVIKPGSVSEKG